MYDEFGNLKKKFRAKSQQMEAGRILPGAGRAGWEVEELGTSLFTNTILLTLKNNLRILLCACQLNKDIVTSLDNFLVMFLRNKKEACGEIKLC